MLIEDCETQTREELFIELYEEVFPKVAAFIKKMGGNLDDTKDIFQDGLVIYYEKKMSADLMIRVDETAYLIGICKHLWYKKHQQDARNQQLDVTSGLFSVDESGKNVSKRILDFIESSGKKCLDLLQAFYFDKLNMKDIAHKFNFSGERSATAQKFKCLEKVRIAIKNRSLTKEDFYE